MASSTPAYDRRANALARIAIAAQTIVSSELSVADSPLTAEELEAAVNRWLDGQRVWNRKLLYSARTFVRSCLENLLNLDLVFFSHFPPEAGRNSEIIRRTGFSPSNTLATIALAMFAAEHEDCLSP